MHMNSPPSVQVTDNGRVILNAPAKFVADLLAGAARDEASTVNGERPWETWIKLIGEKVSAFFRQAFTDATPEGHLDDDLDRIYDGPTCLPTTPAKIDRRTLPEFMLDALVFQRASYEHIVKNPSMPEATRRWAADRVVTLDRTIAAL